MTKTETRNVQKRKLDINGQEFTVFGDAPWMVIPVEAINEYPACYIIIEASLLGYALHRNKHIYNALATVSQGGATIGVAFTGNSGKARADEIVRKLNFKF